MPFLGLGCTPNYAEIDGKRVLRLWTFWLEGHAADGSVLVLVGSADNLLSVDPAAFSPHELRPGFNYPSSTDGLTALVLATNPSMRTSMPDEEWGWMNLADVDVAAFALGAPRRCDNDAGLDLEPEQDELPTWERGRGRVRGLARVYASATGGEIKARHAQYKWLADDAHVAIAAPYVVSHV